MLVCRLAQLGVGRVCYIGGRIIPIVVTLVEPCNSACSINRNGIIIVLVAKSCLS